jgi:hypothetical protein
VKSTVVIQASAAAVQIQAFAFYQSGPVFIGQKCVGIWLSVVDNLQSFSPVPLLSHITLYFCVTSFILGILYRVKKYLVWRPCVCTHVVLVTKLFVR